MYKFIIIISCFFISTTTSLGQDIKLMTYNIRMDNPNDGENAWPNRKEILVNQLLFYGPDVVGIQEGLEHQVHYLDAELDTYSRVGVGRSDVKESGVGEYSAIYYNHNKFKKLESGTFWLSKTPHIPSRGWDASLNRICTYILLKEKKSGKKFWVFNTHFDHKGVEARKNSAELIIQKIKAINTKNYPVFLMGDLNLQPNEAPIQFLAEQLNDAKEYSELAPFGPVGTFNGFKVNKNLTKRIDYIFVSNKNVVVKKYSVIASIDDLRYPSDHLPVFIEVELK